MAEGWRNRNYLTLENEEKIYERKELLKRAYSVSQLFEIGKWLKIPYFDEFLCCWEIDEDEASMEIASRITDDELKEIFRRYKPREWAIFRGRHYLLDGGKVSFGGSCDLIRNGISRVKAKFGLSSLILLKFMLDSGGTINLSDIKRILSLGEAKEILEIGGMTTEEGRKRILELDNNLRERDLNPGTTADITANSIFLAILHGFRP